MCAYQCAGLVGSARCTRQAELSGFCAAHMIMNMRKYDNKPLPYRTERIREVMERVLDANTDAREDIITDVFLEIYVYNNDLLLNYTKFRAMYMLKLQSMHAQGYKKTLKALRRVSGDCIHMKTEHEHACAHCRRYARALKASDSLPASIQSLVASYCAEIWLH